MTDPRAAARAIDALRRGWSVAIGNLGLLAIETADPVRLADFDRESAADVLLSHGRAVTLKLVNQRAAGLPDAPVMIARLPWLDFDTATALADPALDLATPLKGPFRAVDLADAAAAAAALQLARMAGILPAFFVRAPHVDDHRLSAADLEAHEDAGRLTIATRARLPVSRARDAEIVAFRTPESASEHVALLVGQPDGVRPPLVRLHSECLTGDVLGSLKCDCGPQLNEALRLIEADRWGILLYLRQEGRGIGLINKLRAYALQDQGFDTVDANTRLGFAVDARDFAIAGRMLALLGQRHIRLLTNNPAKVSALEAHGVRVSERIALRLPANEHNARYLATKRDRTGHQL